MTEHVRILMVDDHQMFIDGMKSLLSRQDKYQITAEANDGRQALQVLEERGSEIDLIITDLSMPVMPGLELVKEVKSTYHDDIKILVLSMHNNRETVGEIVMSEAEGYILKNTGKEELITALDRICDGGTYYSNEVISIMIERVVKEKKREEAAKFLTEREIEILKLILEENSSEEIAEKLFISRRTVDTHRKNILHKTEAKTIVGVMKFAIKYDLVNL